MADGRTCYGITKCVICKDNIYVYTHSDSFRFFCDKCIKDLREIINERRKPKVVEICFNIPGSASPAEGGA